MTSSEEMHSKWPLHEQFSFHVFQSLVSLVFSVQADTTWGWLPSTKNKLAAERPPNIFIFSVQNRIVSQQYSFDLFNKHQQYHPPCASWILAFCCVYDLSYSLRMVQATNCSSLVRAANRCCTSRSQSTISAPASLVAWPCHTSARLWPSLATAHNLSGTSKPRALEHTLHTVPGMYTVLGSPLLGNQ